MNTFAMYFGYSVMVLLAVAWLLWLACVVVDSTIDHICRTKKYADEFIRFYMLRREKEGGAK